MSKNKNRRTHQNPEGEQVENLNEAPLTEQPETVEPSAEVAEPKAEKPALPRKLVKELVAGETFRYKSSKAVWTCTANETTDKGQVVRMQKEGGKEWPVRKERDLNVEVLILS